MSTNSKRAVILAVVAGLWLATCACSCSDLLAKLGKTASPTPRTLDRSLTATPSPEPTAQPTLTPTPLAPPKPGLGVEDLPDILSTPDTAFTVELTQQEINEYLAGKTFSEEGFEISNVAVVLTEKEIFCELRGEYPELGMRTGLSIRGVPETSGGKLYFRVSEITLDDSLGGFTRLMARSAIKEVIKQYSTPHGLPVPIENVDFQRIELMSGRIIVVGCTR